MSADINSGIAPTRETNIQDDVTIRIPSLGARDLFFIFKLIKINPKIKARAIGIKKPLLEPSLSTKLSINDGAIKAVSINKI